MPPSMITSSPSASRPEMTPATPIPGPSPTAHLPQETTLPGPHARTQGAGCIGCPWIGGAAGLGGLVRPAASSRALAANRLPGREALGEEVAQGGGDQGRGFLGEEVADGQGLAADVDGVFLP